VSVRPLRPRAACELERRDEPATGAAAKPTGDGGRPLRIAQVLVGFRSDGGAERVVRTLLQETCASRNELTVFTLKPGAHGDADELRRLGSALEPLPARRLVDPIRFVRLVRTLRQGDFDIVHTHLSAANILGVLAARLLGIPSIVTLHSTQSTADDHWYHGRLERLVLRRFATTLIAVGEETALAQGSRIGRSDLVVLPNAVRPTEPVDETTRRAVRREIMSEPDGELVLTVGRLEPPKAHDDLLEAFAALVADRPTAELAIVGRGSLHSETAAHAERLGLADRVHFLGVRDDVSTVMQSADVFALSSRWEGLPMVLLEAMECGLPIVSTDVGDVGILLHETPSRVVAPGEPDAFAAALQATLDDLDAGRDLTSAGSSLVRRRYSSAVWADELLRCYRAACG
jgi:glycosyltransferase involved in cell wall biosynthesis